MGIKISSLFKMNVTCICPTLPYRQKSRLLFGIHAKVVLSTLCHSGIQPHRSLCPARLCLRTEFSSYPWRGCQAAAGLTRLFSAFDSGNPHEERVKAQNVREGCLSSPTLPASPELPVLRGFSVNYVPRTSVVHSNLCSKLSFQACHNGPCFVITE